MFYVIGDLIRQSYFYVNTTKPNRSRLISWAGAIKGRIAMVIRNQTAAGKIYFMYPYFTTFLAGLF